MSVHPAVHGFADATDVYDRIRPDYPSEAVDWLIDALGLDAESSVLDLAAGTGKLTGALARTRARVIAVDPVAPMLDRLRARLPEVLALEGTAEALPLADASVDAVTVAQAFHWFDPELAFAEAHRVLRPGGRLALVWNRRELAAPAHALLDEILTRHKGDTPRHREYAWRPVVARGDRFAQVAALELPFEQRLGGGGLVDRAASTSFVAALPEDERAAALAEVERLERRLGEPFVLPHVTEAFVFERR